MCEGSRSTQLLLRTGEEGDVAPPKMRFLIGFARPRAMASRHVARPELENGRRTRIERAADVDYEKQGMLAEFEAPRRPRWKSCCQHNQGRPETLLLTFIARILSRAANCLLRG